MTCSVCSSPCASDLCASCSGMLEVCQPAGKAEVRDAAKKRYIDDQATEGVAWAVRVQARLSPERAAERRQERYHVARAGGASVSEALDDANGIC